MKSSLRNQKQDVVREALYNAALDIFAAKGFDETTVEEVAQAAGVSRRTFFRYFDSKDDLLSYPMSNYAKVLAESVGACPTGYSPLQILHATVLTGVHRTAEAEFQTRQVITIASRSASARQAYRSRMMDVEESLAVAFAARFNDTMPYELRPRLLAAVTLMVMNASIVSWFQGQHADLLSAAKDVLSKVQTILCTDPAAESMSSAPPGAPLNRSSKKPR